nr:uncharacterized protein [Tanacetum cinerariifolium]
MYEKENEVTIYVTTNKEIVTNERQNRGHSEDVYQPQGEDDDSDGCSSEGSYHSYIGSDNEDEIMNYKRETISDNKNNPTIEVNSRFSNAVVFKRALNHYALMNEFEYFIEKSEPTRFTASSLAACSRGFILGCRPYISLDGCHLKGKFNGVLVAATCIDGNNSIFPVAYRVLESENTKSWTWFLNLLKEAIGTPNGLVISSDMQKGLEVAISEVYPNVEHRECIRHLYSNFKKKFRGDIFNFKLCGAARTYCDREYERLLNDISVVNGEEIRYLNDNHKKIWSRSKFGTISKCDYITNNISESFNSWIGELRYQPVINLLDAIIERLMNLGDYEICRGNENRAVVKCKGTRWEVILDEIRCTCRVWQVKGLPYVHAVAFIVFIRDNDWEKYVDGYFTIEKFKEAYAMEISSMLAIWTNGCTQELRKKYTRLLSNTRLDDQGRLELRHTMREKKGTSVRDVVNLDIMKRDARILHLKIRINIKLQLVKEDEERVPKLFKVRNQGRSVDGHATMKLASDGFIKKRSTHLVVVSGGDAKDGGFAGVITLLSFLQCCRCFRWGRSGGGAE